VAVGVQENEYGAAVCVERMVAPMRYCTCVIAAGPPLAVTESVVGEFTVSTAPAVGLLNVIAGADEAEVTETFTALDVTADPELSVTRAVSERVPAVAGVQLTL
jgi:hypothetical protein